MAVHNTSQDILSCFSTVVNRQKSRGTAMTADSVWIEAVESQTLSTSELRVFGTQMIDAGRSGELQPIYEELENIDNNLQQSECKNEEQSTLVFQTKTVIKESKAAIKIVTKGKDVWDVDDRESIGRLAQGILSRLRIHVTYAFSSVRTNNIETPHRILKWVGAGIATVFFWFGMYCPAIMIMLFPHYKEIFALLKLVLGDVAIQQNLIKMFTLFCRIFKK